MVTYKKNSGASRRRSGVNPSGCMAEIATEMLHNMGNKLNSIRTHAQHISDQAQRQEALGLLSRINELLSDFKDNPEAFMQEVYASKDPIEMLLIFNTVVLLNDFHGFQFEVDSEQIDPEAMAVRHIEWRVKYLTDAL